MILKGDVCLSSNAKQSVRSLSICHFIDRLKRRCIKRYGGVLAFFRELCYNEKEQSFLHPDEHLISGLTFGKRLLFD